MSNRTTVRVGRYLTDTVGVHGIELHVCIYDQNGMMVHQRLIFARPGDMLDISPQPAPDQQNACVLMRQVISKAMKGTGDDKA